MHVPNVEAPTAEEQAIYPPYPEPLHTGNVHDDDATVMDSVLQENAEPGLPFPMSAGEARPGAVQPPSRLFTGTITLTEAGNAQRLVAYDPRRCDLQIFVQPVDNSLTADGSLTATGAPVTGPVAFTSFCSIPAASLPDGWYRITGVVQMTGTTAAADINNMRIATENNVLYVIPINPGTAGTTVTIPPIMAHLNGSESVRINNPGNATGTAIYQASLVVERVVDAASLAIYSPVLFSSDLSSLAAESVSAVVNASTSPNFRMPKHNGEVWATVPTGSAISTVKVSWIATTI